MTQATVLDKMSDGLRLWTANGKWGLERPITRDLRPEETYAVANKTANALLRRGLIESSGTISSLQGRCYYRLAAIARQDDETGEGR